MKDLKRSQKLIFQLLIPFYFDVFTIQLDLLAQSIVMALYFFIIGFFLQLLYME